MLANIFHSRSPRRLAACQRGRMRGGRRGLSLLEVILALSLLGIASAIMAQAMQMAASNAIAAQRQAQAELAAESVLSQVIAGVIPMQPSTSWTPIGVSASTSNWSYMLQSVTCEVQNMVGIEVSVRDESDPDNTRPADLTVIRWVIDPALGLDMPAGASGSETGAEAGGQAGGATGAGQPGTGSGGLNGRF